MVDTGLYGLDFQTLWASLGFKAFRPMVCKA